MTEKLCIDDPALQERFNAHHLQEHEHLTIAEKLTVASAKRTFILNYLGVGIEAHLPMGVELDEIVKLYDSTSKVQDTDQLSDIMDRLAKIISALIVDESVTPEYLKSGAYGYSLYPKFIQEALNAEKKELESIESFRSQ